MADYVGAIDQGTTSTRFMVFDRQGSVICVDQKEHEQIYPNPGWVEHDPAEIWTRTQEVMQGALERGGLSLRDLAAIGVTNQRETTLVWSRSTGEPLHNAVVWQDLRTDNLCRQLERRGLEEKFRQKAGLPIATYFSGPKVRWLLENVPEIRKAADGGDALFGTVDTWLVWKLTGEHVTDVTNASRTMLMNLHTLTWDDELLEAVGVPRALLPEIRPSSDPDTYGAYQGVPVCGALGDQQAALVGQACFEPGAAKNTYGTGSFLLMNTGAEPVASRSGLITTVAYRIADETIYALEGSIAITGAAVQWLRDNLGLIRTAREVEELAGTVEDNGGVYFVPAFSGLFAPYWRSDARGVIVGLTRYANKGHLARATLEAICYQAKEVAVAMEADSGVQLQELRADGGASVNDTLMQLQADILGAPVVRPVVAETTSLGSAYAAGLAVGYWTDLKSLRENWQMDRRWEPRWSEGQREEGCRKWQRAVERAMGWAETE